MSHNASGIPAADWDEQLEAGGGHLFQSRTWAVFQAAQGRQVHYAAATDGSWSWLAALREGRGGIRYLYASYGPTAGPGALPAAISSLLEAGRAARADFVRLEPRGDVTVAEIKALGGRPAADMQPRYQLVLDIAPDEAELRHAISPSNRNLINTAEKRGLSFVVSTDPARLPEYLAMQRETANRGSFKPHPDAYYEKLVASLLPTCAAHLYFAEYEGKPVASAICVDFGHTRYYVYAATYVEANKRLKGAIALLWWMILDAKSQGLTEFNYGGIAPDDQPNHPWAGHTRFKRSIGGEMVSSIGTWEIPLKPAKYGFYRLANKVLRK
jgi:lipid II:glycine glycyltransferase (peptidoglycan interpeptide bridge formation enzyme)